MGRLGETRVKVSVPATTSNLGPGYDVLGMAIDLRNELEVVCHARRGPATVEISGEGAGSLPAGESNLVVRSFRKFLPRRSFSNALTFRMKNEIPLRRGLGSSAAARLCGMLAAAALKGPKGVDFKDIVTAAARAEGHPDNAVPAFFGGLCGSYYERGELRFFRVRPPKDLAAVLCVPDFEVSTEKARALMPEMVPIETAVRTSGRLALMIAAFQSRDYARLASAMDDTLHQPVRARLVPGMAEAIRAAVAAGAYGAALSGSGPAIFALAAKSLRGFRIGADMSRAFHERGRDSRVFICGVDTRGARIRTYR